MANRDYQNYSQDNFCGGINEHPEEARPDQYLDGRNIWCPEGRLETRPGSIGVGVYPASFNNAGTQVRGIHEDNSVVPPVYTTASTTTLDLSSKPVGDRLYLRMDVGTSTVDGDPQGVRIPFGSAGADYNTDNVFGVAEYYSSDGYWKPLRVVYGVVSPRTANVFSGNSAYPFLGDDDLASGYFSFSFVSPLDWTTTTVDSLSGRFIRFTFVAGSADAADQTLSASVGLDFSGDEQIPYSRTFAADPDEAKVLQQARGLFSLEFSGSRKVLAVMRDISGDTLKAYLSNEVANGDLSAGFVSGTQTSEPVTVAMVPQFDEGFFAYNHGVYRVTPDGFGNTTLDVASVEDRDVFVGTIAGIKSPFHPDYIAQEGAFPAANYVEFFDGQVWAAGLEGRPFDVHWSAAQPAHKVWPSVSFESLMEDDNSPITGLKAFGEHLAVFKQDSIWRMIYTGVDAFGLNAYVPKKVPGGIGTVANNSIADINGVLTFLSEDGVYVFNGAEKPQKISGAIDQTIKSINPGRRKYAAGVHWRRWNMYLLAVSVGDSDTNNTVLAYDYEKGGWHIWSDITVETWMTIEGAHDDQRLFFGDEIGNVMELKIGVTTDREIAIDDYFTTQRYGFGTYNVKHANKVRTNLEAGGVSSLAVSIIRNDNDLADQASGTLDCRDSQAEHVGDSTAVVGSSATVIGSKRRNLKLGFRETGEWFSVKLRNNNKNKPMKVHRLTLQVTPGAER